MNYLQLQILFFIDEKIGPNKQIYFPFQKIYLAAKSEDHTDETIFNSLSTLTDDGYLETTEGGYRITNKGFIFLEAYIISLEIKSELKQELTRELQEKKEELQKETRTAIGYQWLAIAMAFITILIIVLSNQ